MSLSTVRLALLIGKGMPSPAPARIMGALDGVEVEQSDDGGMGFGQGFQLTFRAERSSAVSRDYAIVTEPALQPGSRVVVSVTINATPRVLLDGIVSSHQLVPANDGTGARFVVSGNDLSVLMDMVEIAIGYPALNHAAIVAFILAKYLPLGIVPMVIPPIKFTQPLPTERVPFQDGTDREYIRRLASSHGYVFGIKPGPAPLMNVAYWGPRVRVGLPQSALSVDMGAATNVTSIQFSNSALAPEQVYGTVHVTSLKVPVPYVTLIGLAIPMASKPALIENQPFVRKVRGRQVGGSVIDTLASAQGRTNDSVEEVVTASGTLDALRYGGILTAPGIVGVRGAGHSYDGYYYVKSVRHSIAEGTYTQDFTLTREGIGSLTGVVRT